MRDFSLIKKNILQYLDFKDISKYEFYKKTGISNGVLSQKSGMSEENTLKFLSYYHDVNAEWLLTGKGEMLSNSSYNQSAPVYVAEEPEAQYKIKIPYVSISAIAGFGNSNFSIQKEDVKDYYVIPKFKDRKIDFMIEVSGNSMYPKYSSGDVVACTIISESKFIQWNKAHVIGTREQGILVKRIRKADNDNQLLLVSDNKEYEPFIIDRQEITGIALVVGVIRLV